MDSTNFSQQRVSVCYDKILMQSKKTICYEIQGLTCQFRRDQVVDIEPNTILISYNLARSKKVI